MLVDPGLAFVDEALEASGGVVVCLGLLLRCYQLALQLLVSGRNVFHLTAPHILRQLGVHDLGLRLAPLGPSLEQLVARAVTRYTEQKVGQRE